MTNLKRIREERGFSQGQLAVVSGVSIRNIQYYEQRYRDINKAQAITLYQISKVLKCKIEDILEIETT